jgi:shikimate dehydrogenase
MKLFCLFSDERVFRSKAPDIYSSIFKKLGIQAKYIPFRVKPDDVGNAMQSLRVLNIDGANITMPYKESVLPYVDILSEGANIIQAVNTVIRSEDKLKGYNTNAIGFMDTLEEANFSINDKTALVFGTGGAAKAIVFILNWLRANSVTIAGRSIDRLNLIVDKFGGKAEYISSIASQPVTADIIINTSSISSPEESMELAQLISRLDTRNCELIIDLNYGRSNNFWAGLARSNGIKFIDGLTPLSHSARRNLILWTKIDVDYKEFRKAANESI